MLLTQLLHGIKTIEIHGNKNIDINAISISSNEITADSLFVAIQGTAVDAHIYIDAVLAAGAAAVVCSTLPNEILPHKTYIKVHDTAHTLGWVACNFYDHPSKKIKLIGITGTNGKTTTATVLFDVFRGLGYSVGLVSTIQNRIDNATTPATHTTPNALALNQLLATMADSGCAYVFMEVSSHAVAQHRTAGLQFEGGVFTNLTHDHLDFHKTFAEYLKAKKTFFDQLSENSFALTNIDDKNGGVMLQNTQANKYSYALKTHADYKAKIIENDFGGLLLNFDGTEFHSLLVGSFNAYNLLAVYATALLLHQNKTEVLQVLSTVKNVAGRFDYIVGKQQKVGIIDYAHTPDALENVLATIKNINQNQRQIITVVGCGGNRDATKRPEMAKIACQYSHKAIFTTDNPRHENPNDILADMQKGVPLQHQAKTLTIPDRTQAIKTACMLAQNGDIILIAGKGHETYQEIAGIKHPYDDKKILQQILLT
jgi:UDP-N-acetylmuramoyl-L-alanyl-D-glutamate--2,6-diaminopimelate ligase